MWFHCGRVIDCQWLGRTVATRGWDLVSFSSLPSKPSRTLTTTQELWLLHQSRVSEAKAAESPDSTGSNPMLTEKSESENLSGRFNTSLPYCLAQSSPLSPPAASPPSGLFGWYSAWKWKVPRLHPFLGEGWTIEKNPESHTVGVFQLRGATSCAACVKVESGAATSVWEGEESEIHSRPPWPPRSCHSVYGSLTQKLY